MTPTPPQAGERAEANRVLTEYARILIYEYNDDPPPEARVEAMARALATQLPAADSTRLDWLETHDDPAIEGPFQYVFPSERWIVRHRNHTVSGHATIRDAIDAAIAALDSEEAK